MTSSFFIAFVSVIVILGVIPLADAHTAKVVGDFKIDIGWEIEPPIYGVDNAIVITVSVADESDKLLYDMIFFNKIDDSNDETTEQHILGLTDTLESYILVESSKTTLILEENSEKFGMYSAKYTPTEIGIPTVQLSGVIKNIEFELTSKIEKIEEGSGPNEIPEWIKNNAEWWAEGSIDDDSFIQGIQYLIKEGILQIPPTESNTSSGPNEIPEWIKNNAEWWAEGSIDDDSFIQGMQYLVNRGIIQID
ncbi:MAG: peptidase [Candidatus Nitrosopumilus sp. bin_7KS]